MCLLVAAYRCHPEFPLIVVANRDEFFRRPTAPAEFWADYPEVLAGRDLRQGGTWMGVNRHGHFAALTNVRDPNFFRSDAKSRGHIVADFLTGQVAANTFLANLARECDDYNGFNLILGDINQLYYFHSVSKESHALAPGLHGLSNARLNTPWPKVVRAKNNVESSLRAGDNMLDQRLFDLLRDDTMAADHELPDTGVGQEKERWLSRVFIRAPEYGTRSSTLMFIQRNGAVRYAERSYNGAETSQRDHEFEIIAREFS